MPEIRPLSPLHVVVGPTASGKTALAVRLAEVLGGEIVGADSVQIYRRFDIGAGKPTAEELSRARHHLIDCVDPMDAMDAAQWAVLAEDVIADIGRRGRVPIVAGGTFLWVRALLYGLSKAPPADPDLRERHRVLAESEGRAVLHEQLRVVDPVAASRLAPNDFVRVSRALEVYELTGRPQSEWHDEHGFREPRYDATLYGIRYSAEDLTTRIAARVASMFDEGFVDEVRGLVADGYRDARAMKSVGYRQIVEALDQGEIDRPALLEAVVRATRVFARRQRTWLREESVRWIEPADADRFTP